jgi:hypothetical protein
MIKEKNTTSLIALVAHRGAHERKGLIEATAPPLLYFFFACTSA